MAEGTAPEVVDPSNAVAASMDMDVENVESADNSGDANQKRALEEEEPQDDVVLKKQKVDEEKSVEEQRLEKLEEHEKGEEEKGEGEIEEEEEKEASGPVNLGPKSFGSSLEMFHYFYNFLHAWPQYLNINKVYLQIPSFSYSHVRLVFYGWQA